MGLQDWEVAEDVPRRKGGQGTVTKVKRKVDNALGALKELHRDTDDIQERRFRMQQEVNALRILGGHGTPHVLDDNADRWTQSDQLFAVLEWIDGPTLAMVVSGGPLSIDDAVDVTRRVLTILDHCHRLGIHHRDIKPDNIILRGSSLDEPYLVDFGMAWSSSPDREFATEGQEVGNRFLRLPEHAAGQDVRDPRSDVTFAAGLLFYLITGKAPRQLRDPFQKAPHEAIEIPTEVRSDRRWPRLRSVFNVAFDPALDFRYASAQDLLMALDHLEPDPVPETKSGVIRKDIQALVQAANQTTLERRQSGAERGAEVWKRALEQESSGTGFHINFGGQGAIPGLQTIEVGGFFARTDVALTITCELRLSFRGDQYQASFQIDPSPVRRPLCSGPFADVEGLEEAMASSAKVSFEDLLTEYRSRLEALATSPAVSGERISRSAARVAEYLVSKSATARAGDQQVTSSTIAAALGLPDDDEMKAALHELYQRNFLHDRSTIGGKAYMTEMYLYVVFDKYWKNWIPQEDAVTLAQELVKYQGFARTATIAEKLGWTPRRMNPAIVALEYEGAADMSREVSSEWHSSSIAPNDETRRFLRGR